MTRQVFISHSATDRDAAEAIRAALEGAGVSCWIAPRDIPPGAEWAAAIMAGIAEVRVVLLLHSAASAASQMVLREVNAAADGRKAIVPVRIDGTTVQDAMQFYLGSTHWLDASAGPLAGHLARIVAALGVGAAPVGAPAVPEPASAAPALPALPDTPSIAVLPFANMSGDAEQEYFADGMVEDITTALSRIGGLFVIARNSSFTYKGRAVDVKQVGRELGVRYVLEGSVRRAGGRVRITCQLIAAASGTHVWAERFDGPLEDVFALQDQVTASVAAAIEPTLRNTEIERSGAKPTASLDAYDLYLRAWGLYHQFTREAFVEALGLLRMAIAIDPRYAQAKAMAAFCITFLMDMGVIGRDSPEVKEAIALARSALAEARDDPTTLRLAGHTIAFLDLDIAAGRAALDRALAINPNSAHVRNSSGWVLLYAGEWAAARQAFSRSMRLSPLDPERRFQLVGLASATMELGEPEQALELLRQGIAAGHGEGFGRGHMIHCLVLLGRIEEARAVAQAMLLADPGYSLANARASMAPYDDAYRARRLASYRAAGIPEG